VSDIDEREPRYQGDPPAGDEPRWSPTGVTPLPSDDDDSAHGWPTTPGEIPVDGDRAATAEGSPPEGPPPGEPLAHRHSRNPVERMMELLLGVDPRRWRGP